MNWSRIPRYTYQSLPVAQRYASLCTVNHTLPHRLIFLIYSYNALQFHAYVLYHRFSTYNTLPVPVLVLDWWVSFISTVLEAFTFSLLVSSRWAGGGRYCPKNPRGLSGSVGHVILDTDTHIGAYESAKEHVLVLFINKFKMNMIFWGWGYRYWDQNAQKAYGYRYRYFRRLVGMYEHFAFHGWSVAPTLLYIHLCSVTVYS